MTNTYKSPEAVSCSNCKNYIMSYDKICYACSKENSQYLKRPSLYEAQQNKDEREIASLTRDMEDGVIINIV